MQFVLRDVEGLLDQAARGGGRVAGRRRRRDLAFVGNATTAVNNRAGVVCRWATGDDIPGDGFTRYNACRKRPSTITPRRAGGAPWWVAPVPFPVHGSRRESWLLSWARVDAADASGHAGSHQQPHGAGLPGGAADRPRWRRAAASTP